MAVGLDADTESLRRSSIPSGGAGTLSGGGFSDFFVGVWLYRPSSVATYNTTSGGAIIHFQASAREMKLGYDGTFGAGGPGDPLLQIIFNSGGGTGATQTFSGANFLDEWVYYFIYENSSNQQVAGYIRLSDLSTAVTISRANDNAGSQYINTLTFGNDDGGTSVGVAGHYAYARARGGAGITPADVLAWAADSAPVSGDWGFWPLDSNTDNVDDSGNSRNLTFNGTLTSETSPTLGGAPDQNLTPSLYTNSQTFFGPTVAPGDVTLLPGLYTNGQTFHAPTVSPGDVSLAPTLVTNAESFFGPTVTQGPAQQQLTPGLFTNTQGFFAPTVAAGAVSLSPSLVVNAQTFYGPSVGSGAIDLAPGLVVNAQTFYAPSVLGEYSLQPSLATNVQSFYAPAVAAGGVTLQASLFTNQQSFFGPSVAPGAVTLSPALFTNLQTFHPAIVVLDGGPQTLLVPLLSNQQTFFRPRVAGPGGDEPWRSQQAMVAPGVLMNH